MQILKIHFSYMAVRRIRYDRIALLSAGKMPLDTQRALLAYESLGKQIGLNAYETALGVIEITNSHMERALRLISVERGIDPSGGTAQSEFTLLSFGGGGGLHAANLARRLGIRKILIPALASTLSAYGMLASDIVKDYFDNVRLAQVVVKPSE